VGGMGNKYLKMEYRVVKRLGNKYYIGSSLVTEDNSNSDLRVLLEDGYFYSVISLNFVDLKEVYNGEEFEREDGSNKKGKIKIFDSEDSAFGYMRYPKRKDKIYNIVD
jgi:hypothetical protein